MTEPAAPATSAWFERLACEVARGRHVIVHGNVHDPVRWSKRFVPVSVATGELLTTFGYQLIGRYDVVDGIGHPLRHRGGDEVTEVGTPVHDLGQPGADEVQHETDPAAPQM